jgi:hypothetical protein
MQVLWHLMTYNVHCTLGTKGDAATCFDQAAAAAATAAAVLLQKQVLMLASRTGQATLRSPGKRRTASPAGSSAARGLAGSGSGPSPWYCVVPRRNLKVGGNESGPSCQPSNARPAPNSDTFDYQCACYSHGFDLRAAE